MKKRVEKRGVNALLKNRKAQITVFMIVGIILLFSTALLFYIRGQVMEGVTEEMIPTIEEVPLEAQPIKLYVEQCMEDVGEEAIREIGWHGGYVEPGNIDMSGETIFAGTEPTESDAVLPLDGKPVVYWQYLKSPNTCSGGCMITSLKPALRKENSPYSIESQMNMYINRELPICLDDFKIFREQGFEFNIRGEVDTDARVTERDIMIVVTYPIQAVREGKSTDITRFLARLDLNFKEIFEMATNITQKEIDTAFLETHTMNYIAMYSMPLSMERLPPIAEYTLDPNEYLFWTRTQTQERLEDYVLQNAVSALQVDQSRNFKRTIMFERDDSGDLVYDRIGTALMDKTILRLGKNYTDISANFDYLAGKWPIYLDINNREVLTSTSLSIPIINWLGSNSYEFSYSIAYPVMVTLEDPDAFLGEGYTFRFALEPNLRRNEPINATSLMLFADEVGTLVCRENQKQSAPVTIEVKNKVSGEPIENARITMTFGREACRVGITELNEENKSIITEHFPIGLGELRVSHIDYLDYSDMFLSTSDTEQNITIELMPYRYINISAFSKQLHYQDYEYIMPTAAPTGPIKQNERFIFIFERQDDDEYVGYSAFAQGLGPTTATLKIIPGTYNVRGQLIINKTIVIPKESKQYSTGLFGLGQPVLLEVNETILDRWQIGGARLNNNTRLFTITEQYLFSSERLNMYLIKFEEPKTHSQEFKNLPSLEDSGKFEEYSDLYRTELEPEWIR
jgi:hypothetical protein